MSDIILADLVLSYLGRGNVTTKDIQPGNDDQRKAAFARMDAEGGSQSGGSRHGSGRYHSDMSDTALHGILTSNIFSKSEIRSHRANFGKHIAKIGLTPTKIEHSTSGDWGGKVSKVTGYTYSKKDTNNTDEQA